ncbi:MAG: hypothetical protein ABSG16_06180 [Candidatus Acidiferrum sp.]
MHLFRGAAVVFLLLLNLSRTSAALDQMLSTIQIGNSRIDVSLEQGELDITHEELLKWVRSAAESVATYYQRFPVTHVALHIIASDGQGVHGGRTFSSDDGGVIRIHVGKSTTAAQLAQDWMLTHEMVHLAFPSVAENHHWIEEGIATYVEPFARVRAAKFDARQMWFEVLRDMRQGLPQSGDQGLDHTHTWGRTYWGGALFCLLADIEIRKQTQNQKGLEDALRGILDAGGSMLHDWPLEKALAAGDQATRTTVLQTLYGKMKDDPYPVDLQQIWLQLGIVPDGNTVRFVDAAPLAAIREGITYGAASSKPKAALNTQTHTLIVGRRAKNRAIS